MTKRTTLSRRHFLKLSGTVGTTALIAACAPGGAPEAASSGEGSAAMQQSATQSIPELLGADMPGSPDHPNGWTTVLPDLPEGLPLLQDRNQSRSRLRGAWTPRPPSAKGIHWRAIPGPE